MDGSHHNKLEDCGPPLAPYRAVDEATGTVLGSRLPRVRRDAGLLQLPDQVIHIYGSFAAYTTC